MTDPGESYEKILVADLQRAIDYLRFAEAKNAGLIVLGSGWFVAGFNMECSGKDIPAPFTSAVPFTMIFAFSAAMIALFSFIPRLNLSKFLGSRRAGPHVRNLLYFGDIAAVQIKALPSQLKTRYYPDDTGPSVEYIHDLTVQLSVNSEIAVRKMRLFSCGVGLIFVAALTLLVPTAVLAVRTMRATW